MPIGAKQLTGFDIHTMIFIWIIVYGLLLWSTLRVKRQASKQAQATINWIFILLVALNIGWSLLFFKTDRLDLAFILLLAMDIVILYKVGLTYQIDTLSALLLIPFGVWIGYQTYLNGKILLK